MSDYRILETDQFQDDLKHNLGSRREKIEEKLRTFVYPQLRLQPHSGKNIKKLKGFKPETWRYRIGGFRFFYGIDESRKIVFMIAADTRQAGY